MKKVEIAVIECGEGWMSPLTGWETYVADDATDEQILEQAIAEVENNDFDVMRDPTAALARLLITLTAGSWRILRFGR